MGDYLTHDVDGTPQELDSYLGTRSVTDLLSDLADDTERQTVVDQAIDGAEAKVNSYLARLYTVPVSPVDDAVKSATGALAARELWDRGHGAPEKVHERAEEALRWLRDVAKGVAVLDSIDLAPASTTGGVIVSGSNTRIMKRDDLEF